MPEGLSDSQSLLWAQGRAQGLREAADQVHTEARWQEELKQRRATPQDWAWHVDRLLMIERLLTDRAAL